MNISRFHSLQVQYAGVKSVFNYLYPIATQHLDLEPPPNEILPSWFLCLNQFLHREKQE